MDLELFQFIVAVFVGCFVVVMLAAAQGRTLERTKIDIRAGESVLDDLQIDRLFNRRRLVVTSHRVIRQEVHWWLARTRTDSIPIEHLDGVGIVHRMNPWILAAGIALFGVVAPVGLLIVILAMVATQFLLTFGTHHHRLRFILGGSAERAGQAFRAVRRVQRRFADLRGDAGEATDLDEPAPPGFERVVPQDAWLGVLAVMAVAVLQRAILGIDLDNPVFLGLYCGIAALVGARAGGRAGFVTGFFGAFGLVSILYPLPLLHILSAGPAAGGMVYLAAALVLGAVGGLAGLRAAGSAAGFLSGLAALAWMLVGWLADAPSAWTASSLATASVAAAFAAGAAALGARRAPAAASEPSVGD